MARTLTVTQLVALLGKLKDAGGTYENDFSICIECEDIKNESFGCSCDNDE